MGQITHLINDQDLGEPRNWQELEITIDWINRVESGNINVSDLSFVGEANKYFQKRILNGLDGGVGVTEGDRYQIKLGELSNPVFTFEGFLDFTQELTVIGGEEIVCGLRKAKGEDWLNDVADGFSFAYLYDQGVIVDSDFVKVPYVINYVPDGLQLTILAMSSFMMTKELIENVQAIAETIADVVDASTPVVGVGIGANAGGPIITYNTDWDLGNFILVTLKALARIAYVIAISVAIINLIEELFNQLLPKKRDHLGMTFNTMFKRSCEHLGMSFFTDIPEMDWVHIPRKTKKGGENDQDDKSGVRGFPTNTEPIYTFGDLIREMKTMFNADYRIRDNTFYFQRKDKFEFASSYQIPNFFNNQERLMNQFKLNTNEMVSNYNIYYSLDVQDQNTLDVGKGRVFQAITTQNQVVNQDFVQIKGLAEIAIPFSMGVEKRSLTAVEEVFKVLGSIVDGITGIFGGGTNFENQIEQRVGSLLLSSDFLTVGKVVAMSGSKLANNQRSILDATNLWENYHFINSLAEYKGEHNQWFIFEDKQVPMTIEEFDILLENNFSTDENGNKYIIETVRYIPESDKAVLSFRVKRQYTKNLKIEIV